MKKIYVMLLTLMICISMAGCGSEKKSEADPNAEAYNGRGSSGVETAATKNSGNQGMENQSTEKQDENKGTEETNTDKKSLVVYFSMPETTNPNNMTKEEDNSAVVIDGEVLGNTQYVAYVIQENTGADIFRIVPEKPYTTNHSDLVDLAKKEQNEDARPAIKEHIENLDEYDTIFIGYPNWWGDMPMILYTFFEEYDFSGKTIYPFNTHGGSGFSGTIRTIAELEPDADVYQNGLTISRDNVQEAEVEIIDWVNNLHLN